MFDRNRKDKRNDCDQDIQKSDHHRTVTTHVFPRKMNRLVCIFRNKILNCQIFIIGLFSNCRHKIFCLVILFFLCLRFIRINPVVLKMFFILRKSFIPFFWHNSHTKLDGIKHEIIIV